MPYSKVSAPPAMLHIELPASAGPLPAALSDPEFLRYALAGTLYQRGEVSGRQARLLTGDSRRQFEEKMAAYGFPLMPDDAEAVSAERDADL